MDLDTTIVALSSPRGRATRALVRASGSRAFAGVQRLGLHPHPHRITKGRITLGTNSLPVLLCAFPEGASYTGQDIIEIQLPNNQHLVDAVIQLLITVTDGRHAEAGEFTARAFFSGRISLTEAEGVCATIAANNNAELLGASLLRKGALAAVVDPIVHDVASLLARVETGIDFTDEEDIVVITSVELQQSVKQHINTIESTLSGQIPMATLRNLPHVVIAGAPNAGKSTLFNTLLGERRVVVSSTAGTTRDAITEPVQFNDKEAMLVDIAGLEDATEVLSIAAQVAAKKMIEAADLILWCVAPCNPTPTLPPNSLVVHTKGDLSEAADCAVSANTGMGLDKLRLQVAQKLSSIPRPCADALALLPRHEQYLHEAVAYLHEAHDNHEAPELTATSLRLALNSLGAITGQITPDEVLGQVFATFCIGK